MNPNLRAVVRKVHCTGPPARQLPRDHQGVAKVVAQRYKKLYQVARLTAAPAAAHVCVLEQGVCDPYNAYEAPLELMPHAPQAIESLLDVA